MELVGGLPEELPAAVFVVMHLAEESTSVLPKILNRSGPLAAVRAEDGEPVEEGRIYVASPAYHLLVEYGRVRVVRGPKENRHRPAVDALFRSAAVAAGPRVEGAVLTRAGGDGPAGLPAVKRLGGVAVGPDPQGAHLLGRAPSPARQLAA